jgi:hypothetical protein
MAEGRPGDRDGKRGPDSGQGGGQGGGGQGGQGRRFSRRRGFRGRPRRDKPGEGQDKQGGKVQPQPQPQAQPQARGVSEAEEPVDLSAPRQEGPRETLNCPLCGKPVYDLSTALSSGQEGGEPAHFDCVLDRVTAAETLESGDKIVYLGSGAFAVVVFKDRSESAFTVKRRIQWEKEGEKKDWRKGLSSRISNL